MNIHKLTFVSKGDDGFLLEAYIREQMQDKRLFRQEVAKVTFDGKEMTLPEGDKVVFTVPRSWDLELVEESLVNGGRPMVAKVTTDPGFDPIPVRRTDEV